MISSSSKWICALIFLFLATFGVTGCLKIVITAMTFLLGGYSVICLSLDGSKKYPSQVDLLTDPLGKRCAKNLILEKHFTVCKSDVITKDKKITGHKEVDGFIVDIIDILIEDYVTSWYGSITMDTEFAYAIKSAALESASSISYRLQSVDWLSYITGKLVDDVACHLRIFRGAGGGVTVPNFKQQRRRSPARSPARTTPHHRRNKSDTDVASFNEFQKFSSSPKTFIGNSSSVEERFFEIEFEMEKKIVSRKNISMDSPKKHVFASEVSQIILFLIFNKKELKNNATLCLLRALLSSVMNSMVDYIVDPDNLNLLLLRMSSKETLSTDSFLTVLRTSGNIEELKSTSAIVEKEIHNLASRDAGGECDIGIKQQLSSLQYLIRLLSNRTTMLTPAAPIRTSPMFLTKLPLGFLLDNHLALCHFLDFAHSVSAHPYIFCYISIEAWDAAALKHLAEIKKNTTSDIDNSPSGINLRASASTIYDQYFSRKSLNFLDVPDLILENFLCKLNQPLDDKCLHWFDNIKEFVHTKLEAVETAFRSSNQYNRLLAELDLEGSTPALESSLLNPKNIDHRRTGSSGANFYVPKPNVESGSENTNKTSENGDSNENKNELTSSVSSKSSVDSNFSASPQMCKFDPNTAQSQPQDLPCKLEVVIVETGLMQERGRAYGVYALEVKRWDPATGKQHCWHVYRRYSDFHELQSIIKEAYPELSKMEFPSKKTFHNTSRNVLERRMVTLSSWINALSSLGSPGGPPRYALLHVYLLPFLSQRGPQDKQQPTMINSMLVQPLRQGMRTLRNVPEQLVNTVDDIMGGLSKLISNNRNLSANPMMYGQQPSCSNWSLENETALESEEVPLRVLLLLLDEVFELRCRNRWLRRQIAAILRQILTTMFADVLNKKIIDTISSVTSAASVASYLDLFKRKFFLDAKKNKSRIQSDRDTDIRARARVATKTFLLSCRQDELKRLIGSQTTQKGLMTVFELFQNQILNTRLLFILVEGLLKVIFQEKDMSKLFHIILKENAYSLQ